VKNKKSSRDEEGFIPTGTTAKGVDFSVHPSFWDIINNDPDLNREMEQRIEKMVELRVRERTEQAAKGFRERVFEEAHTEGRSQGYLDAQGDIKAAADRLEEVCASILSAKVELMRDHEREWVSALGHVLKRFLVKRQTEIISSIGTWVEDSLGVYAEQHKVKVYLAAGDFKTFSALGTSGRHWEFAMDPSLTEGDLRCECAGAGVFFSAEEQLKKLEELVLRYTEGKG